MARHLSYGAARPTAKGVSSLACLAFVALLGIAFWAGAVWIGQAVLRLTGFGF
ncbi:MAG: hypothetical protein ACHP9T_06465 [Caulobacterales bacterium]|jgi:hypothetical protein